MADYGATKIAALQIAFGHLAAVPPSAITISIQPASVRIQANVLVPASVSVPALVGSLAAAIPTPAAASALLHLHVLTLPTIEVAVLPPPMGAQPPTPPLPGPAASMQPPALPHYPMLPFEAWPHLDSGSDAAQDLATSATSAGAAVGVGTNAQIDRELILGLAVASIAIVLVLLVCFVWLKNRKGGCAGDQRSNGRRSRVHPDYTPTKADQPDAHMPPSDMPASMVAARSPSWNVSASMVAARSPSSNVSTANYSYFDSPLYTTSTPRLEAMSARGMDRGDKGRPLSGEVVPAGLEASSGQDGPPEEAATPFVSLSDIEKDARQESDDWRWRLPQPRSQRQAPAFPVPAKPQHSPPPPSPQPLQAPLTGQAQAVGQLPALRPFPQLPALMSSPQLPALVLSPHLPGLPSPQQPTLPQHPLPALLPRLRPAQRPQPLMPAHFRSPPTLPPNVWAVSPNRDLVHAPNVVHPLEITVPDNSYHPVQHQQRDLASASPLMACTAVTPSSGAARELFRPTPQHDQQPVPACWLVSDRRY